MRRVATLLLLISGCAAAATTQPTPPPCPPAEPKLALTADGEPLELASIARATSVSCGLERTQLDLTFKNEKDRVLEGELVVPLPAGATLCAFALEVNGTMRDAAIVERERARVAFETVVRRGVDPGLVEWSHGNSFRTRVYPIPARGTKRVQLAYEREVPDLGHDGAAATGVVDSTGAFFASVPLGDAAEGPLPPRVTVLWDASLSARLRDVVKERELLRRALRDVERIRLVTFAHEVLSDELLAGAEELSDRLARVELDGGTHLGCLDMEALERGTDAFLLVTDGVSSLGGELAPCMKQLTAIVSAASADFAGLARHGRVLDVRALDVETALHRLRARPRELVGVEGAASVLPRLGAKLEGSLVTIAGQLSDPEAKNIQVLVRDGATVRSVPVSLRRGEGPSRVLARRRVADLLAAPRVDVAAVVSLARAERIATPYTSFVVLETLADYERFGIEPPKEIARERAIGRLQEGITLLQTEEFEKAERFFDGILRGDPANEQAQRYRELAQEGRAWRAEHEARENQAAEILKIWGSRVDEKAAPYIPTNKVVDFPEDAYWREKVLRRREGIRTQPAPERDRELLLEFYDVSDLLNKTPDFPAPELGLPATKAPAPGQASTALESLAFASPRQERARRLVEAADALFARGKRDRALRVLTNLAEIDPGDPALLRVLAYRLDEAGEARLALSVLERVATLRPEEPQSFRDLALAQAAVANVTSAAANFARAIEAAPASRFAGIERVVAHELLHLVAPRAIEADLRVVLTWDANDTDVDLWVTEPSGEKVFYSHATSAQGARLSRDITQGYGPEEYVLERGAPGTYTIQAQFYGDRRQTRATDATLKATIFANYGRTNEERQVVVRRMSERAEVVDLGRVTMKR